MRIRMRLLPAVGNDRAQLIKVKCLEESCGDEVTSNRILKHAEQVHHAVEAEVDTRALYSKETAEFELLRSTPVNDPFIYAPDGKAYCKICETRAMSSAAAHMMLHRYILNRPVMKKPKAA